MPHFTDDLDRAIVRLLEEDGRLPNLEIARRLGVSESTVRKRVARMRREGMRISASLDGSARPTEMLFFINTEAGSRLAVAERLAIIADIQYVAVTTGVYEIVARAAFQSDADALDFLVRRLEGAEGVRSVQTGHVLKNLKMPVGSALSSLAPQRTEAARAAAVENFIQNAAQAQDLAAVLDLACETATAGFAVDRVAIFTAGDDGRARPIHQASRGLSAKYVEQIGARISPEIGVGVRVLNRLVHIYVEDATNSPLMAGIEDLVEREGYRSLLMLPLLYGAELMGTVSLYSDTVRRFDDGEIALAQALADQLAIAVARMSPGRPHAQSVAPAASNTAAGGSRLTRLLVERLVAEPS